MRKKTILALLLVAAVATQFVFFAARQNAASSVESNEMLDLAAILPDSDVVVAMDIDRSLNIAAPDLLNNDAKKIENFNGFLKNIENQLGLNPAAFKQIVAGVKMPSSQTGKEGVEGLEMTAIIRTNGSNATLINDLFAKRELIDAFDREKAPTLRFIEEFRNFRDAKYDRATPEQVKAAISNLEAALAKNKQLAATVAALPKIGIPPAWFSDFRTKNNALTQTIIEYLLILKTDTDSTALRTATIKLLNRWNALAADDADRRAKLAAIHKEAQVIYPAYKKKVEASRVKENALFPPKTEEDNPDSTVAVTADEQTEINPPDYAANLNSELDKILQSLNSMPTAKTERTAKLDELSESLGSIYYQWKSKLEKVEEFAANQVLPDITKPENQIQVETPANDFFVRLKQAQTEQTVGGKRMIVIDLAKTEDKKSVEASSEQPENVAAKKDPAPEIAVGFLNETTMAISTKKNISAMLTREGEYKNGKVVEMLSFKKNAVVAFAANSRAMAIAAELFEMGKAKKENDSLSTLLMYLGGISFHGEISYENEGKTTNDISMSIGFSRGENEVSNFLKSMPMGADADTTYDVGGYQINKDIFYDLFGMLRAVRAEVTFDFDKKKVASLIKSTPQIIDRIAMKDNVRKAEDVDPKPQRMNTIQDVVASPRIYVDLVKLISGKIG